MMAGGSDGVGIYWRISSFPELEHLSPSQRRALMKDKQVAAGLRGAIARAGMCASFAGMASSALFNGPNWWDLGGVICIAAVAFAASYLFQIALARGAMRIHLERVAQHEELPMCLNCGYDLRGHTGDRCPECGAATSVPPVDEAEGL